jgi:hypothetical protein
MTSLIQISRYICRSFVAISHIQISRNIVVQYSMYNTLILHGNIHEYQSTIPTSCIELSYDIEAIYKTRTPHLMYRYPIILEHFVRLDSFVYHQGLLQYTVQYCTARTDESLVRMYNIHICTVCT